MGVSGSPTRIRRHLDRRWVGAAIGALALAASACGPASGRATPGPLQPIILQLRWTHNAQFAGFYAADQNGYYAEEGLQVSFVEGGAEVDLFKGVLEGTAQFGIHGADALLAARAQGKPVQAVAVIYRRSPTVFIALARSGIERPQDLVGQTIQVGSGSGHIVLHAMLGRLGIDLEQVTEVPLTGDLDPLLSGEVQVISGFLMDQPLRIEAAGEKANLIYPDDYGIHFYGDTLWTTDEFADANPDVVGRFLRASLQGWAWAVENPIEAGRRVGQYRPEAELDQEAAKMTASIPLVNTGEDYIGWMRPELWSGIEAALRQQGVLTSPLDIETVYTLQFLEEIYGK